MQRKHVAAAIAVAVVAGFAGVVVQVEVFAGANDRQPAATITLPAPGVTTPLYDGWNIVTLTFPDGTAPETVTDAVAPANAVGSIWRHGVAQDSYAGFSTAAPQASDLATVNFLDVVWVWTGSDAPAQSPTPPNRFLGDVSVYGSPPPAGTNITATIGGNVCGQTTVKADSTYILDVVSEGQAAGCGTEGATVRFAVAGQPAGGGTWHGGYFTLLDLAPSPVGGIAELPVFAGIPGEQAGTPSEGSGWSAGSYAALSGGLAAVLAVATGAWYARRRWLR